MKRHWYTLGRKGNGHTETERLGPFRAFLVTGLASWGAHGSGSGVSKEGEGNWEEGPEAMGMETSVDLVRIRLRSLRVTSTRVTIEAVSTGILMRNSV